MISTGLNKIGIVVLCFFCMSFFDAKDILAASKGTKICGTIVEFQGLPGMLYKIRVKESSGKVSSFYYTQDEETCDALGEKLNGKTKEQICFTVSGFSNDHMGMESFGVTETPMVYIDQCSGKRLKN